MESINSMILIQYLRHHYIIERILTLGYIAMFYRYIPENCVQHYFISSMFKNLSERKDFSSVECHCDSTISHDRSSYHAWYFPLGRRRWKLSYCSTIFQHSYCMG